ncbi:putative hydrolase [compost metagenome]
MSHLTLDEAIDLAKELKAEQTYLTHISHRLGKHEDVEKILPKGVKLAYDGMVLTI